MTLRPWREIITPHEDVLEGSYEEASFAADLTKVVLGVAPPDTCGSTWPGNPSSRTPTS